MYTQQSPKVEEVYEILLDNYEEFQAGVKKVLATFGVEDTDCPVEPPSKVNIPFKPNGLPDVVFIFTTSKPDQNKEFQNPVKRLAMSIAMKEFITDFSYRYKIEKVELWFKFDLSHWTEIVIK